MKDVTRKQPLSVSTDGMAVPYIMVPVNQLDAVRRLLDAGKISYVVDEDAISLDDEPEMSVINLSLRADPQEVQSILDSVP